MTHNERRNETSTVSLPSISKADRSIDRSIDQIRSDPIRSREISALRYRHEARQPRALSRSRSPCLIAIRSIASRSIALQTSIVSHHSPPLSEHQRFPSYISPVTCFVGYHSDRRGKEGKRGGEKSCRHEPSALSSIIGFLLISFDKYVEE